MQKKIEELEQIKMKLFYQKHLEVLKQFPQITDDDLYLYHRIRFGTYKEQLMIVKRILQTGILPKNRLPRQHFYSDNCNDGTRISLLEKKHFESVEFETFIKPNFCFIVSPFVQAYETIYVSYEEWLEIQKQENLHNFYSYARGEYQTKTEIPVSMIQAIGIPYFQMVAQQENPRVYLAELISFCNQIGLYIPIVDHSICNQYVYKK